MAIRINETKLSCHWENVNGFFAQTITLILQNLKVTPYMVYASHSIVLQNPYEETVIDFSFLFG